MAFAKGYQGAKEEAEAMAAAVDKFEMYTGSAPAADAAATGTKVFEKTSGVTFGGTAADQDPGARVSLSSAITGTAAATGTPGYYRFLDSSSNVLMQGDVVEGSGSAGEIGLDNTDINSGQNISIDTFTYDVPES